MGTRDPRIDAYVEKARPFAQPILRHLREVVHRACPEVAETMKWSMPHFDYRGTLCSMAAFKGHCTFGFWKGALVVGDSPAAEEAMGHFGRIASLDDLPPEEEIAALVRRAMELNEQGVKAPRTKTPRRAEVEPPAELLDALSEQARAAWDRMPPSHRREYAEWITEAKTDATRRRRIATAAEWIAEGKGRNWKYERPRPAG
jgi:hypothetical protein